MEVPFSPFVGQQLVESSTDLCGEVDGNDVAISGDRGVQRVKLLLKPKAMDTYRVNHAIFNFTASNVNLPLKACDMQEVEFVSVPLNMVQWFEQDV